MGAPDGRPSTAEVDQFSALIMSNHEIFRIAQNCMVELRQSQGNEAFQHVPIQRLLVQTHDRRSRQMHPTPRPTNEELYYRQVISNVMDFQLGKLRLDLTEEEKVTKAKITQGLREFAGKVGNPRWMHLLWRHSIGLERSRC